MGFRRRGAGGGRAASLAIVLHGEGLRPDRPAERPLTLGQLVGRLRSGTSRLTPNPEDSRNVAKPVRGLCYGAFGSYAPSYDSTFATITKEETSLIHATYSSYSTNAQTERLLNYAKENDYALVMADSLVELLGGSNKEAAIEPPPPPPPTHELASLTQLGIDTSFLEAFEKEEEVDRELNESWALLGKLHQEQTKRLSLPNPPHQPSPTELIIVEKVTKKLTELTRDVPPGAVAPLPAVRRAMRLPPEV